MNIHSRLPVTFCDRIMTLRQKNKKESAKERIEIYIREKNTYIDTDTANHALSRRVTLRHGQSHRVTAVTFVTLISDKALQYKELTTK